MNPAGLPCLAYSCWQKCYPLFMPPLRGQGLSIMMLMVPSIPSGFIFKSSDTFFFVENRDWNWNICIRRSNRLDYSRQGSYCYWCRRMLIFILCAIERCRIRSVIGSLGPVMSCHLCSCVVAGDAGRMPFKRIQSIDFETFWCVLSFWDLHFSIFSFGYFYCNRATIAGVHIRQHHSHGDRTRTTYHWFHRYFHAYCN